MNITDYEFKSEFFQRKIAEESEKRAVKLAEQLAAKSVVEAMGRSLLSVLTARGLPVSEEQRANRRVRGRLDPRAVDGSGGHSGERRRGPPRRMTRERPFRGCARPSRGALARRGRARVELSGHARDARRRRNQSASGTDPARNSAFGSSGFAASLVSTPEGDHEALARELEGLHLAATEEARDFIGRSREGWSCSFHRRKGRRGRGAEAGRSLPIDARIRVASAGSSLSGRASLALKGNHFAVRQQYQYLLIAPEAWRAGGSDLRARRKRVHSAALK